MTTYFTLLTPTGLAKIANAQLTQNTVAINQVAVGDSNGVNYTPTGNETALKKERWRGGVASVNIDTTNPNWIVVEAVIPSSVGGFTLREVALYDVDGDMIAIGNYPDTYKPLASDGSTMDLVLRTIIEVSNASSITLRIDPNVIVASRKYVDDKVGQVHTALTEHSGQIATVVKLGHIKPDGKTIKVDPISGVARTEEGTPYVIATWDNASSSYLVDVDGITEYKEGLSLAVKIKTTNSSNAIININNIGRAAIRPQFGVQMVQAGGMLDNYVYTLRYNGDSFILQGGGLNLVDSLTSTSITEAATAFAVKRVNDKHMRGTGSPEGQITAPIGTLYTRTDTATATTTLYVKTSGAGNTGWTAK